ncbi:hypothetical protein CONLIGDRAFT_143566 [Coniochaeta ligniaria NRRL 30616]|uniref:Ubiquitin-like protease family profile domain-containing protein n=1 Tax=Coniochaeta ligniaria NRRL 30616 TaxID=1408157 RepID=A0A1J7J6Q4_9PEZI|nr:hypothetical protein CONLIGDRAFT_143566 [Coniochaeta ligniaria NRRL 30616]
MGSLMSRSQPSRPSRSTEEADASPGRRITRSASVDFALPLPGRRHTRGAVKRFTAGMQNVMSAEAASGDDDVVYDDGDYDANIRAALDAVVRARDDLHTGAALKKAWRSLIAAYSKKSDALNFPLFARERLDDDIIIEALYSEFGHDAVIKLYHGKRGKSNIAQLTSLLGLPDAQLLALWFGADDIRTPTRESRTKIYSLLSFDEDAPAAEFLEHEYPKVVRRWGEKMGLDLATPHGRMRCVFARTPFQDLERTPKLRISPKDFGLTGKSKDGTSSQAEEESAGSEAGSSEDGSSEAGSSEPGSSEAGEEEAGEEDAGEEDAGEEEAGDEDTSTIHAAGDVISSPTGQREAMHPPAQDDQLPSLRPKEHDITSTDEDTSTIFAAGDVVSTLTGKSALRKKSPARPTRVLDTVERPAHLVQSSAQNPQVPTQNPQDLTSNTVTPDRHQDALLQSVGGGLTPDGQKQAPLSPVAGPLTPRPSITETFASFSTTDGPNANTTTNLSWTGAVSDLTQRFADTPMTELEQSSFLDVGTKRKADASFASPTSKKVQHSPQDEDAFLGREETLDLSEQRRVDDSFPSPTSKPLLYSANDEDAFYGQWETPPMDEPDVGRLPGDQPPGSKDANPAEVRTGVDAPVPTQPEPSSVVVEATTGDIAPVPAQPAPSPVIVDDVHGQGQAAASMIAILNAPRQWLNGAVMSHFLTTITSMTQTHAPIDLPSNTDLNDRSAEDFAKAISRGQSVGVTRFLAAMNPKSHWVLVELEPVWEPTEVEGSTGAVMNLRLYDSMSRTSGSQDIAQSVEQTVQRLVPKGTDVRLERLKCPQQPDANSCGVFVLVFSVFVVTNTRMPARLEIGYWRGLFWAWSQQSSLVSAFPGTVVRVTHRADVDPEVVSPSFTEAGNETSDKLASHRVADVTRLLQLTATLVRENLDWYRTQRNHAADVLEWVVDEAKPVLSALAAAVVQEERRLSQDQASLTHDIEQMKKIIEALRTMKGALVVGDLMAGANDGRLAEAISRLNQIWRRLEICRAGTGPFEKLALRQLEQTVQQTLEAYVDLVQSNQHMLGSDVFAGLRAVN